MIKPELRALAQGSGVVCGHMDQIMIIVPSRRLVVLRMGVALPNGPARAKGFYLVVELLART